MLNRNQRNYKHLRNKSKYVLVTYKTATSIGSQDFNLQGHEELNDELTDYFLQEIREINQFCSSEIIVILNIMGI